MWSPHQSDDFFKRPEALYTSARLSYYHGSSKKGVRAPFDFQDMEERSSGDSS
jgi:hypothetical protein